MTHDEKIVEAVARAIKGQIKVDASGLAPAIVAHHITGFEEAARAAITAYQAEAWQPIETAPRDGSHFLAYVVDLVDEYDEDDRLIARGKPEPSIIVAYNFDLFGGERLSLVQYPWNGGMPQNRTFKLWQPLPPAPKATP